MTWHALLGKTLDWLDGVVHAAGRHRQALIALAIAGPITLLAWGVYDRDPPIRIFAQFAGPVPAGVPGSEVRFSFPVERDLERDCSLSVQRWIVDSAGQQRLYGPEQTISPTGLRLRDKLNPDRLELTINVPETLSSGRAHLLTEASYVCPRNLTTLVYPIRVSFSWPFDVLPPQPPSKVIVVPGSP